MYYDIIFGRLTTVDREITARCIAFLNRADPDMLQFMQYNIDQCDALKGDLQTSERVWSKADRQYQRSDRETSHVQRWCIAFTSRLSSSTFINNFFFEVTFPTRLSEVTEKGAIKYSEVVCENVRKLEAYVEEMALGTLSRAQSSLYEGVVRSLNNSNSNPRPTRGSRRSSS